MKVVGRATVGGPALAWQFARVQKWEPAKLLAAEHARVVRGGDEAAMVKLTFSQVSPMNEPPSPARTCSQRISVGSGRRRRRDRRRDRVCVEIGLGAVHAVLNEEGLAGHGVEPDVDVLQGLTR